MSAVYIIIVPISGICNTAVGRSDGRCRKVLRNTMLYISVKTSTSLDSVSTESVICNIYHHIYFMLSSSQYTPLHIT